MAGIRVDTEWLRRYAEQVRGAGAEVEAARRELDAESLPADSFGQVGRQLGAVDAYERVSRLLLDQTARAGEALVHAGEELREVVEFHTGGDDDSAQDLKREREWL